MTINSRAFRPVHYLGNKSRYVDQLVKVVDHVAQRGSTALDLFSGTGVVSRAIAARRPVVSADIQAYSAILTSAMCEPSVYGSAEQAQFRRTANLWLARVARSVSPLLDYESLATTNAAADPMKFALLVEQGSLTHAEATDPRLERAKIAARPNLEHEGATFTAHYGGVYLSYVQALQLDALMIALEHRADAPADATLVAALMGAVSDAVATVGNHFAQPMRLQDKKGLTKPSAIAQLLRARNNSIFDNFDSWLDRYGALEPTEFQCFAKTGDFREVLANMNDEVGVVYADPPYTRDHYSRFYHVLETIALADEPGVSRAPGSRKPSRGLYRQDRHQSPFSIRSQAPEAFEELFSVTGERGVPVVLSYSPQGSGTPTRPETRLMTLAELVVIAQRYFGSVEVSVIEASVHSKFNRADVNGTAAQQAEAIVVARN